MKKLLVSIIRHLESVEKTQYEFLLELKRFNEQRTEDEQRAKDDERQDDREMERWDIGMANILKYQGGAEK